MSKFAGTSQGPTWEDVYDYIDSLQSRFYVTVTLKMRLFRSGKPPRLHGSCIAVATTNPLKGPAKEHGGHHLFRGSSGASTASAGFYMALADLEGRLEGIEKVAQERMPF